MQVVPPPDAAESEAPPRAPTESLEAWVARLATAKAKAVESQLPPTPPRTVLACDTIGVIDGKPLGKPADRRDAARMLTQLSGRLHRVLTGSCLWPLDGHPNIAVTESILEMAPLSEAFLEMYLDSDLWQGKAGACGFQDGVIPLTLVAGSGSNVIGLPLETIRDQLSRIASAPRASSLEPFAWHPARCGSGPDASH